MHVLPIYAGQVAFASILASRAREATGGGPTRLFKTRYRRWVRLGSRGRDPARAA